MQDKMQFELNRISEDYNMGFITPFEALCITIDTLHRAGEEIEDKDEREAWEQTVYASYGDNENMLKAWEEISEQWINS